MDNLNNKISIFGLGYVGCVSLGCLAEEGNHIIGVDIADLKIELINKGQSPIVEEKINHLISDNHKRGRVKATKDTGYAIDNSKISFICVGTPNDSAGHLNLSFIYNTANNGCKADRDIIFFDGLHYFINHTPISSMTSHNKYV